MLFPCCTVLKFDGRVKDLYTGVELFHKFSLLLQWYSYFGSHVLCICYSFNIRIFALFIYIPPKIHSVCISFDLR